MKQSKQAHLQRYRIASCLLMTDSKNDPETSSG